MRVPGRVVAAGAALASALLLAGCASAPPPTATSSRSAFEVLGFQEQSSDPALIDRDAARLGFVGVDGVTVAPGGGALNDVDPAARTQLARAHAHQLGAELLVSNFDDRIGDFSPQLGTDLLSSPSHREHVIAQLTSEVRRHGWDGVMVDLESLRRSDAAGLTAFVTELHRSLGGGVRLDIAVMAADSSAGYRALGYDLPAIATQVDRVTLMSYDQHGPWDPSDPGSIGALDWQRAVLTAMLKTVPASQIDLGVAGYGYGWGPSAADAYSDADARAAAGDAASWDATAGEWTATRADGTVLWWSDARSLPLRIQLAKSEGLAGVAIWSLGQSDPLGDAGVSRP